MNLQKTNWKSPLILLVTATIWGFAFVAQSVGTGYVEPFTFTGVRNIMGAIVLLPVIFFTSKKKEKANLREDKKALWLGGILCGLCIGVASCLQQIGIQYTTAGKAGFLTAMYIIIVPVLGTVLFKHKCGSFVGISIVLATIGLYLLSIQNGFSLGLGDTYVMASALVFAVHILVIDHFAPKCSSTKLSCIQFLVGGVLSMAAAFLVEHPDIHQILEAWLPLAYTGILSSGVGYTLQIVGQKGMNPTVASLILSLESVISVLAGWLILNQALTLRELVGCVTMFAAIILAQLPAKDKQ